MKTKTILHLAAALTLLHTAGCMTPPKTTKPVYRQEARQWQLASITVLPIQDARLSKDHKADLTKLGEAVSKTLGKYGYDVTVSGQEEGVPAGSDAANEDACKAEAQKVGALLKCDGVLFSRLDDYESSYKALYRTDRLEMHFTLRDKQTGDRLWEHHTSYHKTYIGGVVGSAIGGPSWVMVLGVDWAGSLPATKKQSLNTLGLW